MKTETATQQTNTTLQCLSAFFTAVFLLLFSTSLCAQDVLMGLTSNGGPEGKGTLYSYKTDTKAFNVIKGFANWGERPVSSLVQGTDGYLYGMTPNGGTYGYGTIFKIATSGDITILKNFDGTNDGGNPKGSLIQATDGNFWGMTSSGPNSGGGCIFKLTPDGKYSVVKAFSINTDGGWPQGHLIQAADGHLYGVTRSGGASGYGTIFKLTLGGSYNILKSFNGTSEGGGSYGSLMQASDGAFYGMTHSGGTYSFGVIFRYSSVDGYKVIKQLNRATDAAYPDGDLVEGKDGYLYGMSPSGVSYNGIAFKINKDGTKFFKLHDMYSASGEGGTPYGTFVLGTDGYFYGMTSSLNGGYGGTLFKMHSSGSVTVLKKLTPATDGSTPLGNLIQLPDGSFYGMTQYGGKYANGTIFKYKAGTTTPYTVLAYMNGSGAGSEPQEALALAKDSTYFGVTYTGGTYNYGTIFKTCGGVTTVLRSFNRNVDGSNPSGGLVRGRDGNLYGTTESGGTNGGGTIFKYAPATGSFTTLRHLAATADGSEPHGTLAIGGAGDSALYGITSRGGTSGSGTIFKITPKGGFTVLRHLVGTTDGSATESGLVFKDSVFYGMTGYNTRFFKINANGYFKVLKTLVYGTDGSRPRGNMIVGKDGYLYGALGAGGTYQYGVIFKISTDGNLSKLKYLNGTTEGGTPMGGLAMGADGATFYGTTSRGGTNKIGTIFKIVGSTYTVLRHFTIATDGGTPLGGVILAPKITLVANAQSGLTTTEDVAKAITLTGSGATNITYNILIKPRHGSVSIGSAAARTYTPAANYNGVDSFAFTTNLGCLSSAPAWVKITISAVNDAPVLNTIGNKTVATGTKLSFLATASDVDAGQTKTFSLIGAPAGATISSSGTFAWTPTATGNFTFKVRVTDNGSPALYDEETITVTVSNPTLNATLSKQAVEETASSAALYPNPVVSDFTVNLKQATTGVKLTIVDMKGAVVYSKQYNGNMQQLQVNAAQLKPGAYTVLLATGSITQTLRFVKQ